MICVLYSQQRATKRKINVERLREEGRSGTAGQNRWTRECVPLMRPSIAFNNVRKRERRQNEKVGMPNK